MGILDKFFNNKETPEKQAAPPATVEETFSISNEIDTLISIIENLGLLDVQEIYERVPDKTFFDINILTRLKIKPPTLPYLQKYYGQAKFSYGESKIKVIAARLKETAANRSQSGATKESIIVELLTIAKTEIEKYKLIITRFDEALKQIEETNENYLELSNKIEECKTYYKEQELGYPIDLARKVKEMSEELENLPYNGYGPDEIKKFIDAANKMVEDAKLKNEDSVHTLNRLKSDLFDSRKNRFLSDVDTLNKKLQMIDESPYLNELEKSKNKEKTIKDFQLMNGHKQDISAQIEVYVKNLSSLDNGGYGEEIIEKFTKRAETIIADGKRIEKPPLEIKKELQAEYQKLIDNYQMKLVQLQEEIKKIDNSYMSSEEKNQQKKRLQEDFHDEMGLPIDYKDRINTMIQELKDLNHGGYGELKTKDFKEKAFERLQSCQTRTEIRDALREIRQYQEGMIREYQEDLRKLELAVNRVNQDRHLTDEEKGDAIDELDREFKFKVGYRMNFSRYIENRANDLKQLGEVSYGEEAIQEFCEEAKKFASGPGTEKDKYDLIKQKFNAYRKHYEHNVQIFAEWKKIQLRDKDEKVRARLELKLDNKIRHMLSLSPKALQKYYMEDDRKQKEKVEQHNFIAAFKFLAKQESKHRRDETIYVKRIKELEKGKNPYTQKEIEEAAAELELLSFSNEDMTEEEKVISVVDYIDSTLMRQMVHAEANCLKTTSAQ